MYHETLPFTINVWTKYGEHRLYDGNRETNPSLKIGIIWSL